MSIKSTFKPAPAAIALLAAWLTPALAGAESFGDAASGAPAGAGHHRDAGCVAVGAQASMQTPESRMVLPYTLAVAMFALIWPAGSLRFILSLICVNWYQRW